MMEDLPRPTRKRLIRFPVSGAFVHSKVQSSARLAVKIVAFSAVCTALVAEITEVRNNFIIHHTLRAVRVFATLALTSFTYDTMTTSALAQVEGSLQ